MAGASKGPGQKAVGWICASSKQAGAAVAAGQGGRNRPLLNPPARPPARPPAPHLMSASPSGVGANTRLFSSFSAYPRSSYAQADRAAGRARR